MSIMLGLSRRHRIADIEIYLAPMRELEPDKVLPVLREALEIVERANPRPRPVLRGYVRRILVDYPMAARAQWFGQLDLCVLNGEYLGARGTKPVEVASILVHEAQHGRLQRQGVKLTATNLLRIERLCLRVQRDFAAGQPGSEQLLHDLEVLDREAETVWDKARLVRLEHDSFRRAGVSEWLLRLLRIR